ncbi:MAG: hypothetical protein R3E97_18495 [Candidatus Eisenbacteria bacterium]
MRLLSALHPRSQSRSAASRHLAPNRTLQLLGLLAFASSAAAGPNAGGTLILGLCEDINCYTDTDNDDYCPYATLTDCASAPYHIDSVAPFLWYAYAAFPDGSAPRLSGVAFGIDYDAENLVLLNLEKCADFELASPDWPDPGAGTAVTFTEAQQSQLTSLYWFAGYDYYGVDMEFALVPHPAQGGVFADDSVPSILDPIADFGRIGFYDMPGHLPCPTALPTGACCIDGVCTVLSLAVCTDLGGTYVGDDVPCDPNPCVVPLIERSWGRIKSDFREE